MENYNKHDDNSQTNFEGFEEFEVLDDDVTIIQDESLSKTPNALHKKFYHPVLTFDNPKDEDTAKEDDFITPDTLFSPKDKVSSLTCILFLPFSPLKWNDFYCRFFILNILNVMNVVAVKNILE